MMLVPSIYPLLLGFFIFVVMLTSQNLYASDNALNRVTLFPVTEFDPNIGSTTGDFSEKRNLFEGLVTLDEKGVLAPGAAGHWELSEDGLEYTFYLRKGLKWSDGSPLNSEHFVAGFTRAHTLKLETVPGYLYASILNSIEIFAGEKPVETLGVKALDEHTLVIRLKHPTSYFLDLMLLGSFPIPTHVLEKYPDDWSKRLPLVSNGSYQLLEQSNSRYVYQRNPHYWGADQVHFSKIIVSVLSNPNKAFFDMITGKQDLLERFQIPLDESIPQDWDSASVNLLAHPVNVTQYLLFNLEDKVVQNINIRKAIEQVTNRQVISEQLTGSADLAAYSFAPVGQGWNVC